MGLWLLVAIVVLVVVLLALKNLARKAFFKSRTPVELQEIHAGIAPRISFENFSEVWGVVGQAFSIDPRLIRPTDTFKAYSRFDSWDLGKGGDAMEAWLKQQGLEPPKTVSTILDLAIWIDSEKPARPA